MLEPWPAPSSSTSPSRSWTPRQRRALPEPALERVAGRDRLGGRADRGERVLRVGAARAPGQVRTSSTTTPERAGGVARGRRRGISARITGHQSSGTGGFCHSAGSELPFVWVGTTSVPSGPERVEQRPDHGLRAAAHPAERRHRGVHEQHAARPHAERARGRPRCRAWVTGAELASIAALLRRVTRRHRLIARHERVQCAPCGGDGRRGSGWRCCALLAAARRPRPRSSATPIELGAERRRRARAWSMDPAGTAHVVWGIAEELIGYCAIPRGARAVHAHRAARARRPRGPADHRAPPAGRALIVIAGRDDIDADPDRVDLGVHARRRRRVVRADADRARHRRGARRRGVDRRRAGGRPAAGRHRLEPVPAGAARRPAGGRGDQPRERTRRHHDRLRLSRRHGADAQRPHARLPRQPRGRILLPRPHRRRSVRRRVVAAVARRHRHARVGRAACRGRPARRLRDVRRPRPRPGVRRGAAGRAPASAAPAGAARAGCSTRSTRTRDRADLAQDGRGRLHAAIVGYADSGRRECIVYARKSQAPLVHARGVRVTRRSSDADQPGRIRLAVDDRAAASWPGRPTGRRRSRACSGSRRAGASPARARARAAAARRSRADQLISKRSGFERDCLKPSCPGSAGYTRQRAALDALGDETGLGWRGGGPGAWSSTSPRALLEHDRSRCRAGAWRRAPRPADPAGHLTVDGPTCSSASFAEVALGAA